MNQGEKVPITDQVLLLLHSTEPDPDRGLIDVRLLVPELDAARREVYAAVLLLTEAGFLDYGGAGPRVRLTPAGTAHVRQLLTTDGLA